MSTTFRIGDLAMQLSVSVETIRFFEREGLLPSPARSAGNYRLYDLSARDRLKFIVNCRVLDMSHSEIRRLLELWDRPETGCEEAGLLLDEHIGHVADRIRMLRGLQLSLRRLRTSCSLPSRAGDCGILQKLSEEPTKRSVTASRFKGAHGSAGSR